MFHVAKVALLATPLCAAVIGLETHLPPRPTRELNEVPRAKAGGSYLQLASNVPDAVATSEAETHGAASAPQVPVRDTAAVTFEVHGPGARLTDDAEQAWNLAKHFNSAAVQHLKDLRFKLAKATEEATQASTISKDIASKYTAAEAARAKAGEQVRIAKQHRLDAAEADLASLRSRSPVPMAKTGLKAVHEAEAEVDLAERGLIDAEKEFQLLAAQSALAQKRASEFSVKETNLRKMLEEESLEMKHAIRFTENIMRKVDAKLEAAKKSVEMSDG